MENWVTIHTFNYPHEAHIIKGKLESEGIECILKDELRIQFDNMFSNKSGGVKLLVHPDNAEEAFAILREGGYEDLNE